MRVLVLVALVLGVQALPTQETWENYKLSFNKQYSTQEEEALRKELYLAKVKHVEEHNAKFDQGLVTYRIGINKFADFTEEEMKPYTHGFKAPQIPEPSSCRISKPAAAPEAFDWRDQGAIGPVKNQGGCGSCWAFSAIGALEAFFYIHFGTTVVLSEQNLVDCVAENSGCSGGWMNTAYDYIKANGGVDTEEAYPYEGIEGECRYTVDGKGAIINGYINIKVGDEEGMKEIVGSVAPVAVAIDAGGDFSMYESGVYYNEVCGDQPDQLTHALVVVGYGNEDGQDYWLVRNSWGADWGLEGYVKMSRNRDNNCGIVSTASYPTIYC